MAARTAPPAAYADPSMTPGALDPRVTQAAIAHNICIRGWVSTVRPPVSYTEALKAQQLLEYHRTGKLADYEEDHLIPATLGGAPSDPSNLWPEPLILIIDGKDYGARMKDLVENFLHDEVCYAIPNHGEDSSKYRANVSITLERAQEIIKTDWYACYQKMVARKPCQ